MKKLILVLAIPLLLTHCGVKGDPVAPATPAEIGRGKPLFKAEPQDNFPGSSLDNSVTPKHTEDVEPPDDQNDEGD